MSINKARKRSKSVMNENEVLEMLANNAEIYKSVNPKKIKAENMKKIQFYEQMGVNKNDCLNKGKQFFRNNSVDLYKKRNREKKLKSKNDINEINMINNDQITEINAFLRKIWNTPEIVNKYLIVHFLLILSLLLLSIFFLDSSSLSIFCFT